MKIFDLFSTFKFLNTSKIPLEYIQIIQLKTLDMTLEKERSFSIMIPTGIRFMIRSRLYTMEEFESLPPVKTGEEVIIQN